jgi:hypothetical protein
MKKKVIVFGGISGIGKEANYITDQTIAVDSGVNLLTNEALGRKIANLE